MKLLFYNHTAKASGAERVLLMILGQLNREVRTPVVLCPPGGLRQMVEAAGVPCVETEELEARFTWRPDLLWLYLCSFARVIRGVRRRVREIAPDLIHANSIRAGLVMSAATMGLGVPVIWHLHDLLPRHPLSVVIRLFALCFSRLHLLAVSAATAERFRGLALRLFPRRVPVHVILNAVDPGSFYPDAGDRVAIRRELGLAPDAVAVGMIGQITARKGQYGLVRAFACVAAARPEAVLLIAGAPMFRAEDQLYYEQVTAEAAAAGLADRVRFLGPRSDVPALMRGLDMLVVNSTAEPCGLVVLEAMASGVPVIATAVGGNPEMITHKQNGHLIPAGEEGELAEAIIRLCRDPRRRERLAANARARVSEHFTIAGYMAQLEAVYHAASAPWPPEAATGYAVDAADVWVDGRR
ncbi:MAG: glycosyltransferase family 4 protein [Blastocatellia bacterium]